jgi:hypothetical protein
VLKLQRCLTPVVRCEVDPSMHKPVTLFTIQRWDERCTGPIIVTSYTWRRCHSAMFQIRRCNQLDISKLYTASQFGQFFNLGYHMPKLICCYFIICCVCVFTGKCLFLNFLLCHRLFYFLNPASASIISLGKILKYVLSGFSTHPLFSYELTSMCVL